MTRLERLPLEVYREAFAFVLQLVHGQGLLEGKTLGVDSTTLAANAAMKSIVRKDRGDDWQSPSDPDARITHMKDGSTHLAYEAENAVDLDTAAITAAKIYTSRGQK